MSQKDLFKDKSFLRKMTTRTLKLNNIKQLIDLNGDKTNFELRFQVNALNGEEFQALVVTQETLDQNIPLDYQIANGTISGHIVADKNIYQNYCLLLKCDSGEVDVEVITDIKDIPGVEVPVQEQPQVFNQQQQQQQMFLQQQQQQQMMMPPQQFNQQKKKVLSKKNEWRLQDYIFLAIGICLLLVLGWMFYKYMTKPDENKLNENLINNINSTIDEKINNTTENISKIIENKLDGSISDNLGKKIDEKLQTSTESLSKILDGKLNHVDENLGKLIDNKLNNVDGNLGKIIDSKLNNVDGNLGNLIDSKLSHTTEALSRTLEETLSKKESVLPEGFNENLSKLSNIEEALDGITKKLQKTNDGVIEPPLQVSSPMKIDIKDSLSAKLKNLKKFN